MTETTSLKNILTQLTPAKAWGLVVALVAASVAIFSAGYQASKYTAQLEKERTIASHKRELEAVRSSNTVAPGIAAMRKAHRETINLLYDGLLQDINQFIDDIYLPYYVHSMTSNRGFLELRNELRGSDDDSSGIVKRNEMVTLFLVVMSNRAAEYRNDIINPVLAQRDRILENINEAYARIIDSIVTGYLNLDDLEVVDQIGANLASRVPFLLKDAPKLSEDGKQTQRAIEEFEKLMEFRNR